MTLRCVVVVLALYTSVPAFADALDLSVIERMPIPPGAFMDAQFCREDRRVCWTVTPQGKRVVTKDKRERFFGPTNTFFWIASAVVIVRDGRSTLPNLGMTRQYYVTDQSGRSLLMMETFIEGDPLMRHFVGSPAAFYGAQTAIHLGVTALSWKLRRANSGTLRGKFARIAGYVIPTAWDIRQFCLAKRNYDLARQFNSANGARPTGP